MPGDFGQVLSKMRWAAHHLAVLDTAVSDYVDLDPHVAVIKDDPEAKCHRVFVHLRYPPPPSLAHIVGDVLGNLHGVLDYLAWQLAIREGEVPDFRTSFPIVKDPQKDGSEPTINIYRSGTRPRDRVPMIKSAEVLALLHEVQPYKNPPDHRSRHPLQVLRTMNRDSKHRHPAVVSSAVAGREYSVRLPDDFPGDAKWGVYAAPKHLLPFKDGDEMAQIPFGLAADDGFPEENVFASFVALDEARCDRDSGQPFTVRDVLVPIALYIETVVIAKFASLF